MLRAALALVPGVGPVVSGVAGFLGSRIGQLVCVGLAAFLYGHHVAANSARARELARERAVLTARLQEANRQADESRKIQAATEADLKAAGDRDRENRKRIEDYETRIRNSPSLGPCMLDDDFRRRLRQFSGGFAARTSAPPET